MYYVFDINKATLHLLGSTQQTSVLFLVTRRLTRSQFVSEDPASLRTYHDAPFISSSRPDLRGSNRVGCPKSHHKTEIGSTDFTETFASLKS
jgi:hypothetical protein